MCALHKHPYQAACLWLVNNDVLTEEQARTLDAVRVHRNEVAHELPKFAVDPDAEVDVDLLVSACECLAVVCLFWGRVYVATDERFDGRDIADEDIVSPMVSLLDILLINALPRSDGSLQRCRSGAGGRRPGPRPPAVDGHLTAYRSRAGPDARCRRAPVSAVRCRGAASADLRRR
jgi:hypothetical protein